VSPVKYELDFYIPDEDILHDHSRENLESYIIGSYSGIANRVQRKKGTRKRKSLSRCPGRDSNRAPPKYKSRALPLDHIVR
jgi:hypothetical protein